MRPVRGTVTFSLRGGTTPPHLLSTSAFSNTADRSEREIPHTYPSFGATSHAMHLDHPRSRLTPGRARPGAPDAGLLIRRSEQQTVSSWAQGEAWAPRLSRWRFVWTCWGQTGVSRQA